MLVFDFDKVFAFAKPRLPGLARSEQMTGIGWAKNGELVAGAVFEGFNGWNMWMHIAAIPGRSWLRRDFLLACFKYPFDVCGVVRLSGYVDASNVDSRRFCEHLGCRQEARLVGAAKDGGDVIIYVIRREDFRHV
jgi:RimJ/RimL family protein N-acetyltransferase